MPKALITGITGQDGSYLAELLLAKGYEVVGVVRRTSHHSYERIEHLLDRIEVVAADLLDQHSLTVVHPGHAARRGLQPRRPVLRADLLDPAGPHRRVHRARRHPHPRGDPAGRIPTARFYQASSSEMFGKVTETPQRESTPFYPRSPYGVAKVYGHWITVNYRESYGLYAVSGILFNHESPRRGHRVRDPQGDRRRRPHQARPGHASCGSGNLEARRDWGFAGDYVDAMWRMLQQDEPQRLRDRHRRDPQRARAGGARLRPRRARLAAARGERSRSSTGPPRWICCSPIRRRHARELGWTPTVGFDGAGRDDGGRRPRAAPRGALSGEGARHRRRRLRRAPPGAPAPAGRARGRRRRRPAATRRRSRPWRRRRR